MTSATHRIRGGGSSTVKPSDQGEGLFDVWLYLNGKPDEKWIAAFGEVASATGTAIRYEAYAGQPAVAFSGEHRQAIPEVVFAADQLIDSANSRREQMAAEDRQQQAEEHGREQDAANIQNEIDQMA